MRKHLCKECGSEFMAYASNKRKFCASDCFYSYQKKHHKAPHLSKYNRKHNKNKMTTEVRLKIRNAHLGKGKGKSYPKLNGEHEHRIVATLMLGRPLKKDEVVHHIDGDISNNNPSNLRVFTNQSEHARHHRELLLKEGGTDDI